MDLGLSEEQELLKNSAREFLEKECPEEHVRAMEEDEKGYSPTLWKKMAEANNRAGGLSFLSPHPSGPDRIKKLEANVPKVEGLYRSAKR